MTREQFNANVKIEHADLYRHLGKTHATFSLTATMEYDNSIMRGSQEAEKLLKERLWQELYGKRLHRYHELLDELIACNPWTDRERQIEIIRKLHECAPLVCDQVVRNDGLVVP